MTIAGIKKGKETSVYFICRTCGCGFKSVRTDYKNDIYTKSLQCKECMGVKDENK